MQQLILRVGVGGVWLKVCGVGIAGNEQGMSKAFGRVNGGGVAGDVRRSMVVG